MLQKNVIKPPDLLSYKPSKRIIIDGESRVIFFLILVWQCLLPNGFYLFACLITIFLIVYNLQQPLKPGIFTLIAFNHFLQIIAGVWLANYTDRDISFRSSDLSNALIASLTGMLFLFLPIYYFQDKLPFLTLKDLKRHASKLSINRVLNCYLIAFFVTNALNAIAFLFSGFTQVIISFVNIKWAFFLMFGYLSILKKEKRNIFLLCVLVEFVSGFYSFFSEFKTVLYFLIVLLIGLIQAINIKQVIYGALIGILLALLALVWSGIKTDYRAFLNKGSRQQVTSVSKEEALDKLYDLSNNVNQESMNSSVFQVLDRLQYTYFFSQAIARVPSVIPYTNGNLWLNNIEFVTTPRILNPDKPNYDATEKTKKYTGLKLAGRKSGASFSLGYFTECYVDFGFWGMMFPLFLIGVMYGSTYWYFLKNSSSNFIFNYSVVGAFFMEFSAFEMDGTYLLGRFLSTLVTFFVFIKLFSPWIMNYVSLPQPKKLVTKVEPK